VPGKAAVLYFTTDDCGVCRTQQKPALERLKAAIGGNLQIIEINATERPSVADHWGVLSVPTTFLLDTTGRPRRLNHGFTGYARLAAQLAEYLPASRAGESASQLAHE
jgi:thioredoxin-like negative regulator of GroEL